MSTISCSSSWALCSSSCIIWCTLACTETRWRLASRHVGAWPRGFPSASGGYSFWGAGPVTVAVLLRRRRGPRHPLLRPRPLVERNLGVALVAALRSCRCRGCLLECVDRWAVSYYVLCLRQLLGGCCRRGPCPFPQLAVLPSLLHRRMGCLRISSFGCHHGWFARSTNGGRHVGTCAPVQVDPTGEWERCRHGLTRDGNRSVNPASQGHCTGVFIGAWVPNFSM
jgi:hypothetical protein